jgi:hypothetical protein
MPDSGKTVFPDSSGLWLRWSQLWVEVNDAATDYGLLMPGQRKSIEPLAARVGVDSQSLQQLLTSSAW